MNKFRGFHNQDPFGDNYLVYAIGWLLDLALLAAIIGLGYVAFQLFL